MKKAATKTKAKKVEATSAKPPAKAVAKPKERDPRLPKVGTVLTREHDGKVHEVKVLKEGFGYEGRPYRSLSAIAREVTGTIWNGWLWMNLAKRKPVSVEKE
jgi:hypothetical protein